MINKLKDIYVLGIDPGIDRCGFAVLKYDGKLVTIADSGYITTDNKESSAKRLSTLFYDLQEIIDKFNLSLVVLEKLFFSVNKKTAMQISEVRGVIKLLVEQKKLRLLEIHPLTLKRDLVGYGNAQKKQIEYMITQIFDLENFSQVDDVADALALAYLGLKKLISNRCD